MTKFPEKKVLIIGLDGARPDAMLAGKTPNLMKLAQNGCYSWKAQTENHTTSGPAWTSLLTGVHENKHGVDGNDDMATKRRVPTIFKLVKDWNPDMKTIAYSHWEPIITDIIEDDTIDVKATGHDLEMAKLMAADIRKGRGDFHFIQFDDIDAAGHHHGFSPASPGYVKKIEETDAMIGTILKEIDKRDINEHWLVIVISDHGGESMSHGLPNLGSLTIIFIIAGDAITSQGEITCDDEENAPQIVDVVPTIAKFLDMPMRDEWDGVVRGIP
ncbi:MAG TPA: alkaline phosphatase family protein [Candidatus Lokiarchaeia archaeon]|nr:alkaline phosphatase family protein [Candidatus Lokiarchaeia archaeon]